MDRPAFLALAGITAAGWALSQIPASRGVLSEHELALLDTLPPSGQVSLLLRRAINGYQGALEQIEQRQQGWLGKLASTPELNAQLTVAYNSSDLRIRTAALEISLAGYGLAKERATVEALVAKLKAETTKRVWRLWVLGLLGNRGVEPTLVQETLEEFLRDPDVNTRRWAVNGLGMLASDSVIPLLLETFRADPEADIRERAGCNLADAGMFTRDQRMRQALPGFQRLMDDPQLDAQTRSWVFHALREISGETLGDTPAAWRNWAARR